MEVLKKYSTGPTPSSDILFMKKLYDLYNNKTIISSYIQYVKKERYFYKLSPDISLYLGDSPIVFETNNIDLSCIGTKKVIIYKDLVYLIENNYMTVKNLEEMVKTYYIVVYEEDEFIELETSNINVLKSWDKEQLRINSIV